MRILGAMLGGTISSYDSKGTVKLGEPSFARSVLLEKYPFHEFSFPEFKTYSSEDATPYLYRDALKKIVSEAPGFDGILITHGTDTCFFRPACRKDTGFFGYSVCDHRFLEIA